MTIADASTASLAGWIPVDTLRPGGKPRDLSRSTSVQFHGAGPDDGRPGPRQGMRPTAGEMAGFDKRTDSDHGELRHEP